MCRCNSQIVTQNFFYLRSYTCSYRSTLNVTVKVLSLCTYTLTLKWRSYFSKQVWNSFSRILLNSRLTIQWKSVILYDRLKCEPDVLSISGYGQPGNFHCMLSRFISRSYRKHQISSSVITVGSRCELDDRSIAIESLDELCSSVKIQDTNFTEIFLRLNSSFKIISRLICNFSAIPLTL